MAAIIADGRPGAHGRQRVVEQQRVRHVGSVVAGKPDLVHAVIERDDAVLGNDLPDVVDDALRRRRPTILGGAVADTLQDAFAQTEQGTGIMQPALDAVGQQFKAWPDVTDDLALREIDLLDVGRRVADVDHLRTLGAHDEGRLLDGIVADRDDQVGTVDRLMDIIALAECGRSHI